MQVFLPYDSYEKSVEHLDDARLRKQCVETHQLLNAIINKSGWRNHPAAKMFEKSTNSLVNYGLAACVEVRSRGFKWERNYEKIISFYNHCAPDEHPEWLGNQSFHDSHKSRLLLKGEFDSICARIKKFFKIKSINSWLKIEFGKEKNALKFCDLSQIKDIIDKNNIPSYEFFNHYEKFKWNVDISEEYIWPV